MTKFRGKSGSMLSTKRHALLGATALALMAVSQNVYAGAPLAEADLVALADGQSQLASDAPVVDLLSVPLTDAATGSNEISIVNDGSISVSDAETAITLSGESGDVTLVNSGDVSGGTGISVTTGTVSLDPSHVLYSSEPYTSSYEKAAYLQDDEGNWVRTPYLYVNRTDVVRVVDADQADATIQIENEGNITFSGEVGIQATNETGAAISITNSGDIISTDSTALRIGISASTYSPYSITREYTRNEPGDYEMGSFYGYNFVTSVTAPGYKDFTQTATLKVNDGGKIYIENNGTIDMGPVETEFMFNPVIRSQGISATSFEGIEIVNNGTIRVGDISIGITAKSAGNTTIVNNGDIEIGNQSDGISSNSIGVPPFEYWMSGDVTIINSGDISGGMTLEEAQASGNYDAFTYQNRIVGGAGIRSVSQGANLYSGALLLEREEIAQYYVDKFIELGLDPSVIDVPTYSTDYPNLKIYSTNIANSGSITLKDGAFGIAATQTYGEVNAVNSGTITVGNGLSTLTSPIRSIGIYLENSTRDQHYYAYADMYAKNAASGIIVTGDDSAGIMVRTYQGSATVVNEGSITTGNGFSANFLNPYTDDYADRLHPTYGVAIRTMGYALGQKGSVLNSGDIAVGDLAVGVSVRGYSSPGAILPDRVTAEIVNSGSITGGGNSTGLIARGNVASVINAGTVTVGDKDLSGFNPFVTSVGSSFDDVGYGIISEGYYSGMVQNDAMVTTGDGTVGIQAGVLYSAFGYGAVVVQSETGKVTTGDNSIGVHVTGSEYSWLANAGHVSTGDNSVGVEVYGGGVFAYFNFNNDPQLNLTVANPSDLRVINSGIIETGDNSVGVRLLGNRKAEYGWNQYVHTGVPYPWSGEMRHYTGEVEISGPAYLNNSGTIRVGDNSTAVEITAERIVVEQNGQEYLLPHLVNTGTITSGAGGTALKINADATVPTAVDSYVVNMGKIAGDILFGDGDDQLLNSQYLVDGELISTGNIVMNGNTIDFGGGENRFTIDRGLISVTGGDNLITGNNLIVEMTGAEIEARDDFLAGTSALTLAATPMASSASFSTLVINGDVSGTFTFATDVGADGTSDELIITGNVADGSEIGVILNPVEQLKGSVEIRPINIGGTNDADLIKVAGVTGLYTDSLLESEAHYDAATGDVVINAIFGLGYLGTAASAATTMTQNWWLQSIGSYERRNPIRHAGAKRDGLWVWSSAFSDVGVVEPDNGLQDTSFNQQLLGSQVGLTFTREVGGASLSFGPMAAYGRAKAKLDINGSRATGNGWAYGVNGNVRFKGFYVDAAWQTLKLDVDLTAPNSASNATGETNAKGSGFNVEAGYAHLMKSGLTLAPQLQYARVKVDLDDFTSSDGAYSLTEAGGTSSLLRAGVSVYKTYETEKGSVTPLLSLSYINSGGKDGSHLLSNGVEFSSDTKGSGFKADLGLNMIRSNWDFGVRTGIGDTSKAKPSLSSSLTLRHRW